MAARARLAGIRAGRSYLWRSARGWLVVGPTTLLTAAAASKPRGTVEADDDGQTTTVRIIRVVGSWTRDGVDYATAVCTKLPPTNTHNPSPRRHTMSNDPNVCNDANGHVNLHPTGQTGKDAQGNYEVWTCQCGSRTVTMRA